jgi:hypothetical protein
MHEKFNDPFDYSHSFLTLALTQHKLRDVCLDTLKTAKYESADETGSEDAQENKRQYFIGEITALMGHLFGFNFN